jgi:hypothetical protein
MKTMWRDADILPLDVRMEEIHKRFAMNHEKHELKKLHTETDQIKRPLCRDRS